MKGFSVPQVAQKHGWPESLVWSQALVKVNDFDRFKALQWGIRTPTLEKLAVAMGLSVDQVQD